MKSLSHVGLFATPWTVAYQASPSMGFSRQEYWSGLPFPSPGDLPDPGIEPRFPALEADALTSILSPGDLPDPGIEPGSPALQAGPIPAGTEALAIGQSKVSASVNSHPVESSSSPILSSTFGYFPLTDSFHLAGGSF